MVIQVSNGLGVRLGVCLQWLTDLITTGYLEEESPICTHDIPHLQYSRLPFPLFCKDVYLCLHIFQQKVFIALVLFWGGYNIV